jgi:hypothetical protein
MWISRTKDGLYILHKNQPTNINNIIIDKGYYDIGYHSKDCQELFIPEWVATELCDKHNACRPTFHEGPVNLPTHKASLKKLSERKQFLEHIRNSTQIEPLELLDEDINPIKEENVTP